MEIGATQLKIGDPGALKGGAGVVQWYLNIYAKLAPFKYNVLGSYFYDIDIL